MIADRHASRAETCTGQYDGLKEGTSRIYIKLGTEIFEQIKALALKTNRTISGQARELIRQSLEPK